MWEEQKSGVASTPRAEIEHPRKKPPTPEAEMQMSEKV